jgi:hypothetical protein
VSFGKKIKLFFFWQISCKKKKELQHDIHIPKYFSQNSENSPPKKMFHQPVSNPRNDNLNICFATYQFG